MEILRMLAGPLIGALIGYGTNYIAVKMLFRPLHPAKIGQFTLPFTPGIIPRRKQALAHAIGVAVGDTLLTEKDLRSALSDGVAQEAVVDRITDSICTDAELREFLNKIMPSDKSSELKEKLERFLCEKIANGLVEIGLEELLTKEGAGAIREALQGTMFAMFLTDELIQSFTAPIGERLKTIILEKQDTLLRPAIHKELTVIGESSPNTLMEQFGLDRTVVRSIIAGIYNDVITGQLDSMLSNIDVVAIVEQKMNDMRVEEIEELVLSVMKNELDAIVRLGALIGFVIGLLNLVVL